MKKESPSKHKQPPSIQIALVGCGYWGKNLARNMASLGALKYICDSNAELANQMAQSFNAQAASLKEAFEDPEISGIVIASPAETHAELAKKAFEAGKHVYVEKPLALSLDEAENLIQLSKKHQKILMVGHLLQYHPAFLELKKQIKNDRIGKLQYIYSTRLNFGKIRTEEDILWSFAPHDISMILGLVGKEPDSVEAIGNPFLDQKICDTTITHFQFPGGIAGHIFVSWLHPYKEQKLVVTGEDGMMVFDDTRPWHEKLSFYRHKVVWSGGRPEPEKGGPEYIPLEEAEPLKMECQHFLDCIKENKQPRTDGAEGLQVLRVLTRASRSLGQKIG